MKIALISTYPPKRCGIAHFAQNLERSLIACGTGPIGIFTPERLDSFTLDNISSNYDAVCFQFELGLYGEHGVDAVRIAKALTIPVVTTLHADLRRGFRIQEEVLWEVLSESTQIVTPSKETYGELIRSERVRGKVHFIPHGVPDVSYQPPRMSSDDFRVLNFGYMAPHKGLDTLVAAFSIVQSELENATLVLAGADHPDWRDGYRDRLEREVKELGLEGRVIFLNRQLPEQDLIDLIRSSDVVATLYTHLGQGISGVVAYSAAVGRPVISTGFPYARQMLEGHEMFMVPDRDPVAAAGILTTLGRDRGKIRSAGRDLWEATRGMTWGRIGPQYAEVLRAACSAGLSN